MPKFHVIETRAYKVGYLIEAEDEAAACQLQGEILDENQDDSWGQETNLVEKVSDDEEFAPRL